MTNVEQRKKRALNSANLDTSASTCKRRLRLRPVCNLLANFSFDTAENAPPKCGVWITEHFAEISECSNWGICNNNDNDPDGVSNGKQTARKCFREGRRTKRAHRLTSLHTIHRDGTKKKR